MVFLTGILLMDGHKPYISARSLIPRVNQIMMKPRITCTNNGMTKPVFLPI